MADSNEVSGGRVVSQWEWITFNVLSGIKIELSVRWILWAKSLRNTWDSVSILLEKKDEHFNIGKFSKFFIQKKQKSVSELARKSLNTTLLRECSGSGAASEATFI